MNLDELRDALGGNKPSYSRVGFSSVTNIMKFVNVELKMDKTSFDYYYEIDVDDMVNSNMPTDELDALKAQGWSFSNDGKSLILFLKN